VVDLQQLDGRAVDFDGHLQVRELGDVGSGVVGGLAGLPFASSTAACRDPPGD
jgi:hypothetical protein